MVNKLTRFEWFTVLKPPALPEVFDWGKGKEFFVFPFLLEKLFLLKLD